VFYDDFQVGATFVSRGRTVTETDLVLFAGLSGDYSELHTNAERAKTTPAGARIAHGALIFSISVGLTTQLGLVDESLIALYEIGRVRFPKPVFIGDTIKVHKRVAAVDDKGAARGVVTFHTKVVNQQEALVLAYRDALIVQRRPEGG